MCHDQPFRPLLCAFVAVLLILPATARAQLVTAPAAQRDFAGELACAPRSPLIAPEVSMQIAGAAERSKSLYANGDFVIVNAGTISGVQPGQQYFVRRVVVDRFTEPLKGFFPISIHTAGWVQIQDVHEKTSIARVVHSCDGMLLGDYLEPFALSVVPEPAADAQPDFANPAHVILGDERRQLGAAGQMMVIDCGSDHGLQPGQRVTFFRTTLSGPGPAWPVGSGTMLEIGTSTSIVRIDSSKDAISVGDLVAIHR